jgi:hypothetical protein
MAGHRIRDNKLPRDLEEAEVDFRLWIRNEKHFANRNTEVSRRSRPQSTQPRIKVIAMAGLNLLLPTLSI